MLDHREYMREYEERVQRKLLEQERRHRWAYPPQPSLLQQSAAQVGSVLVHIGIRLQAIDPRQQNRQRLTSGS